MFIIHGKSHYSINYILKINVFYELNCQSLHPTLVLNFFSFLIINSNRCICATSIYFNKQGFLFRLKYFFSELRQQSFTYKIIIIMAHGQTGGYLLA